MKSNHVVVWLDHAKAHIIHFSRDTSEIEMIKTASPRAHLHVKAGSPGSGHAAEDVHYFSDIVAALNGALEILIVGPGDEKKAFLKYLASHFHDISQKVVAVETVDHPTDGQLLAYSKKCFAKIDQMR